MGKIKTGWNTLRIKMRKNPKGKQTKAIIRVVQFFAIMVALTIFARGTAGATMPRVKSVDPFSAEISNKVESSGSVAAQGMVEMELPSGLLVKKLYSSQGTSVKEGDNLVEFDLDALNEELIRQQADLDSAEIELRELRKTSEVDDSGVTSAQKTLDKANESYNKAVGERDTAQAAYNDLNTRYTEAYNAWQAALQAIENAGGAANAPADLIIDADTKGAVQDTLFEERYTASQTLETAQGTLDQAAEDVDTAKESLDTARESYQDALDQKVIDDEKNAIAITLKELAVQKQRELVDNLKASVETGGFVTAKATGIISQLPVNAGETTQEGTYIKISTGEEGYLVECLVSAREAGQLQIGGKVFVKRSNQYYQSEATIIAKTVLPENNGSVTIRATLPGTDWQDGEMLEAEVVLSSRGYPQVVPLSAVHNDSNGDYVFVLREEDTILGKQTIARRVDVTVSATDNQNAALDGNTGNLWNEKVLTTSSKPVNEGDRVRLES